MLKDEYLITDAPLKALTIFALPIILGSFFQQIYNMADSIIVGQFVGSSALAAIGACAALTNVFICAALGAGVGAGVLVSRYFGAREYGKMKTIVSTSLLSFLILSVILGVFGYFFSYSMMRILQTPADIMHCGISVFVYVQRSFNDVYFHRRIKDSTSTPDILVYLKYIYGSLDGSRSWSWRVRCGTCNLDRPRHFRRIVVFDLLLSDATL